MAKKSTGFFDEHIEKVVVGVCGLVFLGSIYVGLSSDRFQISGHGPKELNDLIVEQTAQVVQKVQNPPVKPSSVGNKPAANSNDDVLAQLEMWFGEGASGLLAMVQSPTARTQPFPPIFHSTTETSLEDRHGLAAMVAPDIPVIASGRSIFAFPAEPPTLNQYTGTPESKTLPPATRNWVCVAAQVDLVQQDINFKTQKYPDGAFPTIARVHLERFDRNEPWRGWQPVETYLPYQMPEIPQILGSSGSISLDGVSEFKDLLDTKQEFVARPILEGRSGGDRIKYPGIPYFPDGPNPKEKDSGQRVKRWLSLALKAKDGKNPFDQEDPDAAMLLLRAVIGTSGVSERDLGKAQSLIGPVTKALKRSRPDWAPDAAVRPPERLMPIVAYDMNVSPGHTYTYRMRYEAMNIYAGNTGELLNPADAEKFTVFSDWSPETRPVLIESDTYFYLTKADDKSRDVTITVYKKKGRDAVKQANFKVKVGEEIGGEKGRGNKKADYSTGAICLDIDFNRKINGKTDVTLVYVDTIDGSVHERSLSIDKKDKFREALDNDKTARR